MPARFPVEFLLGQFFRVGPAEWVNGPSGEIPDNALTAIRLDVDLMRAYSSNGEAWRLNGSSLDTIALDQTSPALSRGPSGSFDESGAWLNSVAEDQAGNLHGWYHAEEKRDPADATQSHWSVGYAYSTDRGMTFVKPRNNQIIAGADPPQTGRITGSGSPSVVQFGSDGTSPTYLMYFLNAANPGGVGLPVCVARAPVTNGGQTIYDPASGTLTSGFQKWYVDPTTGRGDFSEPGLGGKSTPVGSMAGGGSASLCSSVASTEQVAFVWPSPVGNPARSGLLLSFSDNGTTFRDFPDPLLHYDEHATWDRNSPQSELIVYPSLLAPDGCEQAWSDTCYLFYTYLAPDADFSARYLLRRAVDVSLAVLSAQEPRAKVALTRYYSATREDHWTTTAFPTLPLIEDSDPNHNDYLAPEYVQQQGYVYTSPRPGMVELHDYYVPDWQDHLIVAGPAAPMPQMTHLRRLGWAWATPQPGTMPLYQCLYLKSNGLPNHMVTPDADCENPTASGLANVGILGYVPTT